MSFFFSSHHRSAQHEIDNDETASSLSTRLLNDEGESTEQEETQGVVLKGEQEQEQEQELDVASSGEDLDVQVEVDTDETTATRADDEPEDSASLLEAGAATVLNPRGMFSLFVSTCGYLAPWLSILVFLAPIPTIRQIQRDESVGSLPLLPYTSMITNCFVWVNYGIAKRQVKVWGSNGVGFFLALYYTAVYRQFAASTTTGLHFRVVSSLCFVTLVFQVMQWGEWIGRLGVVICVILFASPLSALGVVISTRSAKSIPLPFTMACIANCTAWSVTGVWQMKGDINIVGPNVMGVVLGLVQVALKLHFGNGSGGGGKAFVGGLTDGQELIALQQQQQQQQTTAV